MQLDPRGELTEDPSARRVAIRAAIAAGIIAILPFLFANFLARPAGSQYVGMQTAVDDNMVYAAWMKQAVLGMNCSWVPLADKIRSTSPGERRAAASASRAARAPISDAVSFSTK